MEISERSHIGDISPQEWRELVEKSPDATVFQTHEWLSTWWAMFGEGRSRSRILVAKKGDRLVGALPLYEADRRSGSAGHPILKWVGSEHTDYHCALSENSDAGIVEALLEAAIELTGRHGEILLEELPQFSTADLVLSMRGSSSREMIIKSAVTPCPRLKLLKNEQGVEAVLRKQSMRRNVRRLATHGNIDVRHMTDPQQIRQYLPEFFEQHVDRWRSTKYPSLFETQVNRRFYEHLTETLGSQRKVVFSSLSLRGIPIAFHFGLCSGNDLLWYKPSFDMRLAYLSPGEVLLRYLITYAAEKGFSALDFTRGDEDFKSRFSSEVRYNSSYHITRRGYRGRRMQLESRFRHIVGRSVGTAKAKRVTLGGTIAS